MSERPSVSLILPGLDALAVGLENELLQTLRGRRLGLLSNPTGKTQDGRDALEVLQALNLQVTALFSPEHGPAADREGDIESSRSSEGLPIYSLYGATRRPTPAMLDGLDAIIFDLQDVGARFYTYSSTLFHLMEECAPRGIEVVVLDRPNPLGDAVEGPIIEPQLRSFIGYAPLPVTHGLTMGELGRFFNAWSGLEARISIVRVQGWKRDQQWPQTGLEWRRPSPNLPNWESAAWYPGLSLLEFSGVSVGRGTSHPFQILAAPWLEADEFIRNWRKVSDITATSIEVTPTHTTFQNQVCQGVFFEGAPPMKPVEFGLRVMATLCATHSEFDRATWEKAGQLLGSKQVLDWLWDGQLDKALTHSRAEAAHFRESRAEFLLYPHS